AGEPFAANGSGSELAEITGEAQLLAKGQHQILPLSLGAVDRRGQATGAVAPVHAIQALVLGPCDPALHGGQGHAELVSDLAHRGAAPDGLDHLLPLPCSVGFLLMAVSSTKGFLPC